MKSPGAPNSIVMLHVFPSFGYGGQQARFAALSAGLGDEFRHVVVALDGDTAARALLPDGVNAEFYGFQLKKSSLASVTNIAGFRAIFNKTNPDILCTYNWGSIEAVVANRLGRSMPHIHFEDGFGADESPTVQRRRRVLARRVVLSGSTLVVPSRALEDVSLNIWKLNRKNVVRIENGIDFDRFQRSSASLRAGVTVGSIGALRPEKNFSRLINAFVAADLAKKATLKIIGAGPDRDHLAGAIEATGAQNRISLPGATSAPEDVYQDFDIFALSSDTEQAPLTLMEAMAAGLPVVATNVGDIARMVAPENRAYITPLGDEEAYALALSHLLQNPGARAMLGAANRKKAKQEFGIDKMITRHRALYTSLARPHG